MKKAELLKVAKEVGITRNLSNKSKVQIIAEIEFMLQDNTEIFKDISLR